MVRRKYSQKTVSAEVVVMFLVTGIALINTPFVGSSKDAFWLFVFSACFVILTVFVWVRKFNLVLEMDAIILQPVLQKYFPFLKSIKLPRSQIKKFSFKFSGLPGLVYGRGYQVIIKPHGMLRYWVILSNPIQDMSHFQEDIIDCLGKDKLVDEISF